uniref:Arp2/3 complex 34 kDa subunit n=1 Tax=Anthurium amnicola TaxID=1678845 RepID=A0A1D1Z0N6_9ARAE
MGSSRAHRMACFSKASPALMELLDNLHSMEKLRDIDHYIYQSGSVRYHIQASASDSKNIYLSMSTPLLSPDISHSRDLHGCTLQEIRRAYSDIVEVVETPKEGFILTLKVNLAKLPQRKEDYMKTITKISSLQAVVLSSQLNDMLWNLGSRDISHGMHRPIKLVFHPREPFFVIRMPEKFTVIFPMRFKDDTDVVIATSFFQELIEACYSSASAKAPTCTWSPIPPAELRGESLQSLSTNGGFVSFDINSSHVKGAKMEKTTWILLNFYAFVKYHVKCTRGFIHRKMRQRLESLSEVLQKSRVGEDKDDKKVQGCRSAKKLPTISKSKMLRRTCGALKRHIRRFCLPIKIKVLARFHRRHWWRMPNVSSLRKYNKLD